MRSDQYRKNVRKLSASRDAGAGVLRSLDDKAEKYLQEELEFALHRGNSHFISALSSAKGTVYLKRQEVQQAEDAFQAALEHTMMLVALAHYGLACVHLLHGERTEAQEQGLKSLEIFERVKSPLAAEVRGWLDEWVK